MRLEDKLAILAGAAKYDVSCASSGSRRANINRGLGNAAPAGICHTYTADGRCVSLLKILFTNVCTYDCAYCINRSRNDIPRASFKIREIVDLTMDFYRRNYIEGLFLSSGIINSPDETMERLVRSIRELRREGFNGYVHLKCVPYASRRLIRQAGCYADRLSVNIELPSEKSLKLLTLRKNYASVLEPMSVINEFIRESQEDEKKFRRPPLFAPAGQSTQLIVGASPESDLDILLLADKLYRRQALKRIYYSAYAPAALEDDRLPNISEPPLNRENRLYQADWLIRLYGFTVDEVFGEESPYLDLKVDPKLSFARRRPELFPVDVNTADPEMMSKVPGIGLKSARRITSLRKLGRIRFEHLKRMGVVIRRALPFICCDGMPVGNWQGESLLTDPLEPPNASAQHSAFGRSSSSETKLVFIFDGTFEGLMTAVFHAYERKNFPDLIEPAAGSQLSLFDKTVEIITDPVKANRVWKGLKTHMGSKKRRQLYEAYLSCAPGVETMIFRVISDMAPPLSGRKIEPNLASHIRVQALAQKVRREAHRMKGFVRFQKIRKNHFVALIEPRHDVLPLIQRHFEARFADQNWIIYDIKRNYGIFYDARKARKCYMDVESLESDCNEPAVKEKICQSLWKLYYAAVNIPQRDNPRLHLRQLPRRFWPRLPEKNPP